MSNLILNIRSNQSLYSSIFLFWNCQNIALYNLTINEFKGRLVFAIYYYSYIKIVKLNISNIHCRTDEKGCIMEINSASVCNITNSNFYNLSSSTSFFNAYTSNLDIEKANFTKINLISSINNSESYTFLLEVSTIKFLDMNITDYNYGFIYAEKTKLDVFGCNFYNSLGVWNKFFTKGAAIRAKTIFSLNLTKNSFMNLRNSYEGSVIFRINLI